MKKEITIPFPSREEAEEAVRTLIRWVGDNPQREGLMDTPRRVIDSFAEFFSGYKENPKEILARTFEDVGGYEDIILLKNIRFESHCEHHMVPIIGQAHVAYLPRHRIVGISKLARTVELFAKRLQVQERLTSEIAYAIQDILNPKGVAVIVEASHQCMTTRGIHNVGVSMITSKMLGAFKENESIKKELMMMLKQLSFSNS